ncbi:MAG: hypothetical protein LQ343_004696 [Gyalolechia ehrenbergii]|nr:MAG: hypothetical protein LQ343_004696 [Gyalolechia ehrenbergii]
MERASSLSWLPPELRERIYHELLHDQPSSLFHLLTVNRRISSEVQPWIFKQPVTFDGQQSLFEWLPRVDPEFLPYVGTVRFKLHDIDSKKIVGSLGERLRRMNLQGYPNGIGDPYKEACDVEITRITYHLNMFKNLDSITILQSTSSDPQPPNRMERNLIGYALENLPLTELRISHETFSQGYYVNKSSVQRLRITDYALVQSPILPARIRSLSQLSKLMICSDLGSTYAKSHFHRHRMCGYEPTDRVLRKLQDLTLCLHDSEGEEMPETLAYKSLERFFVPLTEQVTSLKTFRLLCNNWVGRTTSSMQKLVRFVSSSSLTHIDTGYWWSPLPNEYPSSIVTIAVRFGKNYRMFPNWLQKFYDAISPTHKKSFFASHPDSKEIVLYLSPEAQDELEHVETRQSAVTAICREHSIRLRVIYEEFSCDRQD